jgi:hypothetical protein
MMKSYHEPALPAPKYAIIGTHNIGKTTLCHDVVSRLSRKGIRASFAAEASRTSRRLSAGIRGIDTQLDLFANTLANELEASRQSDLVICDRSLIDVLAYTDELGDPRTSYERLLMDAMKIFANNYVLSYRLLFKPSWIFPVSNSEDPLRIGGEQFQRKIDERIEYHIKRVSAPVLRLQDPYHAASEVEKHILDDFSKFHSPVETFRIEHE